MKVWLACFLLLFALAQLFDWLQDLHLPLPIYILGGAFLAVASNYDKLFGYYMSDTANATIEAPGVQPQLDSSPQPTTSISFATSRASEQSEIQE